MDDRNQLRLGQIVKVLRGRDAGKYAVVVGEMDDRFVKIADGDKRKFDRAKKKNILHLQPQPVVDEEIARNLTETGRVTNAKLRNALNQFVRQVQNEAQQKGE